MNADDEDTKVNTQLVVMLITDDGEGFDIDDVVGMVMEVPWLSSVAVITSVPILDEQGEPAPAFIPYGIVK